MAILEISIGIDNGPTGSIGILRTGYPAVYLHAPFTDKQDYVQEPRTIARLDIKAFTDIIESSGVLSKCKYRIVFERPMVNPARFLASTHALRYFEAQINVIESFSLDYTVIDSKKWNKAIFTHKIVGEAALKQESFNLGLSLYDNCAGVIIKQGDADGLMLAEYGLRDLQGRLTKNY